MFCTLQMHCTPYNRVRRDLIVHKGEERGGGSDTGEKGRNLAYYGLYILTY